MYTQFITIYIPIPMFMYVMFQKLKYTFYISDYDNIYF
jgi:hypothetical protein